MMILNMGGHCLQPVMACDRRTKITKITIATFDCITDILGEIVEKRSLILSSTLQA